MESNRDLNRMIEFASENAETFGQLALNGDYQTIRDAVIAYAQKNAYEYGEFLANIRMELDAWVTELDAAFKGDA